MPGIDLAADALAYALAELDSPDYPERFGVAVFCQMANAPARPGSPNGAKSGPVPVWHMVLTMTNPTDLAGPKLRAPYVIGTGAPDKLDIKRSIPEAVAGLRELGRIQLLRASANPRPKPGT
jgi:hypothetical protein